MNQEINNIFSISYININRTSNQYNTKLQNILTDAVVGDFLECKDDEGYVIIKEKYDGVQYEGQPLVLNVGKKILDKIVAREKRKYSRLIKEDDDDGLAIKIFKHNHGELCVNDIFSDEDDEGLGWEHTDMAYGNFPFLLRQYKTVVFVCRATDEQVEVEIMGCINVDYNYEECCWKFYFRIGKILSVKK